MNNRVGNCQCCDKYSKRYKHHESWLCIECKSDGESEDKDAEIAKLKAKLKQYEGEQFKCLPNDVFIYSGTGQRCDMLTGPCACGAWHNESENERRGC